MNPRAVFAALREDSDDAAAARSEPMAAIVFLAGIAVFLSTSTASQLYDGFEYDAVVIVLETVVAGALVGLQNYWLGGGGLYLGARGLGADGSYRRARHLVGFAMVPLIVWLLVVWPVELAVYGGDLFRTGGDDHGTGRWMFQGVLFAAVAWSFALLLLGVRTVHRWSWPRSLGAVALSAVALGAISLIVALL